MNVTADSIPLSRHYWRPRRKIVAIVSFLFGMLAGAILCEIVMLNLMK